MEAPTALDRALIPDQALVWANKGAALRGLGRKKEAKAAERRAQERGR